MRLLPALAACLLFMACSRKETVEKFPDGRHKLVREYAWPGAMDSLHLRAEFAYFIDGAVESETRFRHGQVDGKFTAYWPNGKIKATGFYKNGLAEGQWEYFYNAYTLAARGTFHNGLREGLWTEYWENSGLRRRGNYSAGKQIGEWVGWISAGGEVLRTSCFESNDAGHYKSNYDNGSLKEEYDCRNEKRVGSYVENDADGNPRSRGFYDTTGVQDSLWETFYSNRTLASRRHFHHGFQNDSLLGWDTSGHVVERGFFSMGTGEWKRYDSRSRVVEIKTFQNGFPLWLKRWHPNHIHAMEGAFIDGKKTGTWKTWDNRGTLRESAEYLNGLLHGSRRFFDSTGVLIRLQQYDRGMPTRGSFPKIPGAK